MNVRTVLFSLCLALLSFQAISQCSSASNKHARTVSYQQHPADIVDIAASDENFGTLVAAVKAADLVKTLKSDGPFTVFAPTNAAFSKLPEGTVASLLEPASKDALTKVLTYHVISGAFYAKDVINAINSAGGTFTVKTVSGDELSAQLVNGSVILTDESGNKIAVTATDVKAANGVIHVVDSVLLPK